MTNHVLDFILTNRLVGIVILTNHVLDILGCGYRLVIFFVFKPLWVHFTHPRGFKKYLTINNYFLHRNPGVKADFPRDSQSMKQKKFKFLTVWFFACGWASVFLCVSAQLLLVSVESGLLIFAFHVALLVVVLSLSHNSFSSEVHFHFCTNHDESSHFKFYMQAGCRSSS